MTAEKSTNQSNSSGERKKNIVLLFGGRGTEHEVSIRSAASIYHAIDRNRFNVIPVAIAPSGRWLTGPTALSSLESGEALAESGQSITLLPDPVERNLVRLSGDSTSRTVSQFGDTDAIDLVFPVLHGRNGEDGTVQGLLEIANLPYVGCGVLGSALGMDKVKQKEIFSYHQIPIVRFFEFRRSDWENDSFEVTEQIEKHFESRFPLFVKPVNTGSSVGISKVKSLSELGIAIEKALHYDQRIVVEEGKNDIREIEVSVLGNDFPSASVCGEIVPSNEFYDYAAKYIDDRSRVVIPADLTPEMSERIRADAIKAFRILECRGLARVDFFTSRNGEEYWLNEINTLPGFTSISMYPKLWEASGLGFQELVGKLIELAIEEWENKQKIQTSFTV